MTQLKRPVHTYSIVARDKETGQLGVAVQSHYFGVGRTVPWAEAGVGAVATQSLVRVDYGPLGLQLMRQGYSAPQALAQLLAADKEREVRQVSMIDAQGNLATHTGSRCIAAAGHLTGDQVSVQANLMVDQSVWPAMMEAYEATQGDLAIRLVAALEAAQAAGGDIRGQQSAAIVIVAGTRLEKPWEGRLFDLRVEDHPRPVEELKRLVQLRRAYQLVDRSDELMVLKQFEQASHCMAQALSLAPELIELRFWAGLNRIMAGQLVAGKELLRPVFDQEPIWIDLMPQIVKAGLFSDDPELMREVLSVS